MKELRCSQCEKPLKQTDLVVRGFFPDVFHVGCVPTCSTCGQPFAVGERAVLWRLEADGRRLMVHAGHETLAPASRQDGAAATTETAAATTNASSRECRERDSACEREPQSDTELELDDDADDDEDDTLCSASASGVKLAMAALASADPREQLMFASSCKLYGALGVGVGVEPGVGVGMPVGGPCLGLGVCAGLCGGLPGCSGCASFGQLAYGLGCGAVGLGDAASVSSAANTGGPGSTAGGPKRPRTILTMGQRRKFKQAFELNPKPSRKVRLTFPLVTQAGFMLLIVETLWHVFA